MEGGAVQPHPAVQEFGFEADFEAVHDFGLDPRQFRRIQKRLGIVGTGAIAATVETVQQCAGVEREVQADLAGPLLVLKRIVGHHGERIDQVARDSVQ